MTSNNPVSGNSFGQVTATANQTSGSLIKDTTTQAFSQDVISESRNQPVLVDFWAPWCGPCKQLTPIIEQAVTAAGGRVKLVKMNIEDHPGIAGQLGIQSIPAVVCYKNGQPVDGFMGAQPDAKIREFIDKVAGPDQAAVDTAAARTAAMTAATTALATGDIENAGRIFSTIAAEAPDNEKAYAGLAECLIILGDLEQARTILEQVPLERRKGAEILAAFAKLDLHEQASKIGDRKSLEAKLVANLNDHQTRFDLAMILNVQGFRDEAAEQLLTIMKADRLWNDDGARKQLVQFFESWGPMDPASMTARRKLSGLLFS